jgi:thiamine-monophosphate kinase
MKATPRQRSLEESWIDWLRGLVTPGTLSGLHLGLGDDAAVWRPRGRCLVLTVDAQVDGTHFRSGWLTARELGRRAVSASVSDLAAMAARPKALLVSLVLEPATTRSRFRALYRGIHEAAVEYGASIIGGNICHGPLSITITALGEGEPGELCRRSGLEPGDAIWVTGAPGLARLGLRELERGASRPHSPLARRALAAFRRPRARVEEAIFIRRSWPVGGMIDLSDGLGTDLRHLLRSSSEHRRGALGAELDPAAFADLEPLARLCREFGLSPFETALRGGEDYELCFTSRPHGDQAPLARAFERRFGLKLTCVGRVTAEGRGREPLLWAREGSKRRRLVGRGFEHF